LDLIRVKKPGKKSGKSIVTESANEAVLTGGPAESPDLIKVRKPGKKSVKTAGKGTDNESTPQEPETKNLG
jgi:hypothetical protein